MAFFPTFEERWTKTPNLFFDEILPNATANQIRIVGYLIRHTLSYNAKSTWIGVTREDLIKEAGVSNGQLSEALQKCEEKGWIFTYTTGSKGHQQRYIFLSDPLNERIVAGLKANCYTVNDLQYLNEAGIESLLERHGITEESILLKREKGKEICSTETGGQKSALRKPESNENLLYGNRRAKSTETVDQKQPSTQSEQAISKVPKNSFKKSFKRSVVHKKTTTNTDPVVVELTRYFLDEFKTREEPLDETAVQNGIVTMLQEDNATEEDIRRAIDYTSRRKVRDNVIGYVRQAQKKKFWESVSSPTTPPETPDKRTRDERYSAFYKLFPDS